MTRETHTRATRVLCLLAVATVIPVATAAERPHVVFVLADDMGYGDLRPFNPDSRLVLPRLESLAADGMRFTDAHAAGPLCHMSRYGLMTGEYPWRIDVSVWPDTPLIAEGRETIASVAAAAGYRTAMVGKWHCGFRERGYDRPLPGGPVDRGFDSFFGMRASTDIPPYFYIRGRRAVLPPTGDVGGSDGTEEGLAKIQGRFIRAGKIAPDVRLEDVIGDFTDEAVAVIERHAAADAGDEPLFLYLAYTAPHTPWLPSEEFVGASGVGGYGDFAMTVDHEVGRVLDALDRAGIADDTLVIFSSDNGPVWYDADVERTGHDSAGPLRGMKGDIWEAGHRMPLLMRWPGRIAAGSASDRLVCFTDFLATFASLWGVATGPEAGPDSVDFSDVLLGERASSQTTERRTELVLRGGSAPLFGVRDGRWKLIDGLGSGGFSKPNRIRPRPGMPAGQLYDLRQDLGETVNLFGSRPDVVARLTEILDRAQGPEGE